MSAELDEIIEALSALHLRPAWGLGLAALLLLGSSFFSSAETALFSLQPLDREGLAPAARARVNALLASPRRTIATLLIGNESVNIAFSAVSAGVLLTLFPDRPWLNLLVVPPFLLLFGEVGPKVLALRYNRRLAPLIAAPLSVFSTLVRPVRGALTFFADAALRLTGGDTAPPSATLGEEVLRELLERGRRQGSLREVEQEVLHRVFSFGDLTVNRLMTPRPDVFSVRLGTPWAELLAALRANAWSRVPVWKVEPDNIIGVLVVKDLLPLLQEHHASGAVPTTRQIARLLRPPRFVPTTARSNDLLRELRKERQHLAIVVDEHGSVAGLVTLEDLLGELVGEVLDENDPQPEQPQTAADGSVEVAANLDVDDFAARFGVELPEGDFNTLAGFLMQLKGEMPVEGEALRWEAFAFTVSEVQGHRLTRVRVRQDAPGAAAEDG